MTKFFLRLWCRLFHKVEVSLHIHPDGKTGWLWTECQSLKRYCRYGVRMGPVLPITETDTRPQYDQWIEKRLRMMESQLPDPPEVSATECLMCGMTRHEDESECPQIRLEKIMQRQSELEQISEKRRLLEGKL